MFHAALARIDALWGAPAGSPEGDELEALVILVEAHERAAHPLPDLDPVDAIAAHMDLNGYARADLADVLGSASRASEILNRRRPLTLAMIRALNVRWGLPAALLTGAYAVGDEAERGRA